MTAETAAVSIGALGAVIAAATGHLAEDEQRLAVAVYRLLSAREPVSVRAAAAVAGTPGISGRAGAAVLARGVLGRPGPATGFWRLALAGMPPHRNPHAGTGLSAWCAWDPLFLALVIGDVQVATAGPVTGEAITSDIARAGTITRRLPPRHGAVVPARRSRSGARRRAGPGGQPGSAGWSLR